MRVDFHAAGPFAAMLVVSLSMSAAGCSLINDFAPHKSAAVVNEVPAPDSVQIKPAVLVQNGTLPNITTAAAPTSTNVDNLPPLPKDDVTPQTASKLLSPDEKARVIAELEALASSPAGSQPPATKAACAATPSSQTGAAQTAAAAACANQPKPTVRP